jgi:saccharopine dehydrogenase-like NADP-dependent oxidoreductase
MFGKTCAGTEVIGLKDGKPRKVYIYQIADNEECMRNLGCQAVVAQTGFNAVIGWDLLEHGVWKAVGVKGPEAFDAVPFMEKMAEYGFPYSIRET